MMKLLYIRMAVTVFASLFLAFQVHAGGEPKKICHNEKVKGKDVEVCKIVKVHKKLNGTKVPPK